MHSIESLLVSDDTIHTDFIYDRIQKMQIDMTISPIVQNDSQTKDKLLARRCNAFNISQFGNKCIGKHTSNVQVAVCNSFVRKHQLLTYYLFRFSAQRQVPAHRKTVINVNHPQKSDKQLLLDKISSN